MLVASYGKDLRTINQSVFKQTIYTLHRGGSRIIQKQHSNQMTFADVDQTADLLTDLSLTTDQRLRDPHTHCSFRSCPHFLAHTVLGCVAFQDRSRQLRL